MTKAGRNFDLKDTTSCIDPELRSKSMPIPLVEFPPTIRLLLSALALAGMILAHFGVLSFGDGSDSPHESAGPPALLPANHRENMASGVLFPSASSGSGGQVGKEHAIA